MFLIIETPGILECVGSRTSCIEVELHCSDSLVCSVHDVLSSQKMYLKNLFPSNVIISSQGLLFSTIDAHLNLLLDGVK